MDPWAQVSQAFISGLDSRAQKKAAEQEFLRKQALMNLQYNLQNQELTPELKAYLIHQQNPEAWSQFEAAKVPFGAQELGLKQAQMGWNQDYQMQNLNLDKQKFGLDQAYKNWMMQQKPGGLQPTNQQQNFEWLIKQPGMTQEKVLQLLFKPDMMSSFMQMMGGQNPGMQGGQQGQPNLNFGP